MSVVQADLCITCDHAECPIAFRSGTTDEREARRKARSLGWGARLTRRGAAVGIHGFSKLVDYCPAHVGDHLTDSVDAGPL